MSDNPFETHYQEYDAWFDAHPELYESELLAVQHVLPSRRGRWVEVGVGSGRFASRLGIEWGVEPAAGIAQLARARGVHVLPGTAESLPLQEESVAALFLITTLCFVRDMDQTFQEVHRVLVPGGHVVVAFIPRESGFGRRYAEGAARDRFFECATLRSHGEVLAALDRAGLRLQRTVQTLTGGPTLRGVEPPSDGADDGSFVVLLAAKPGNDARPPVGSDGGSVRS